MFRSGPLEGWLAQEGVSSIGLPLAFFGFCERGCQNKSKFKDLFSKTRFLLQWCREKHEKLKIVNQSCKFLEIYGNL